MQRLIVRPAGAPLRGAVELPSDKSITHRSVIFASLASGRCSLRRFSYGEDNLATLRAFAQMGVQFRDDAAGTVEIDGVGLAGLAPPASELDCGNSGTTMRLLTGVLAAQPFRSRLVGECEFQRKLYHQIQHKHMVPLQLYCFLLPVYQASSLRTSQFQSCLPWGVGYGRGISVLLN